MTDAQGREIKRQDHANCSAVGADARPATAPTTLQADAVRFVKQRKGKPVLRFTLYGLGIGAVAGAAASQIGCSDCAEALAGGLLFGSLIGAGAGAAIGGMRSGKEVVVYPRTRYVRQRPPLARARDHPAHEGRRGGVLLLSASLAFSRGEQRIEVAEGGST